MCCAISRQPLRLNRSPIGELDAACKCNQPRISMACSNFLICSTTPLRHSSGSHGFKPSCFGIRLRARQPRLQKRTTEQKVGVGPGVGPSTSFAKMLPSSSCCQVCTFHVTQVCLSLSLSDAIRVASVRSGLTNLPSCQCGGGLLHWARSMSSRRCLPRCSALLFP